MNLSYLTDKVLLHDTKKLATSEREITIQVLHHLREIERRKLYSDLKFKSLYDYCVRELKYSEAAAHRRITAARLLKEIPSIEKNIEEGTLNLTNISSAAQFFKEENIIDSNERVSTLKQIEGLSSRECELKLIEMSARAPEIRKEAIWVTENLIQQIKEYRDLKGTSESYAEIIAECVFIALEELQREKFKLAKTPRKLNITDSRTPSASVKREVYLRDKKCVKCGSVFGLQYDHRKPFSLGGKSTPENIRLLCGNCNQRERIRQRL